MGVSIQQYRAAVQTFDQSRIFSYRSAKPKYKKPARQVQDRNLSYPFYCSYALFLHALIILVQTINQDHIQNRDTHP